MKSFSHEGETYLTGEMVRCDVEWKNGHKTNMRGKLVSIYNGEVFIETELGPVAGVLETLEKT